MLTGGLDLKNPEALKEFYIGNARRLSMAGKNSFPRPQPATFKTPVPSQRAHAARLGQE